MNNLDNLHSYDNVEYVQGHELSDEELRSYLDSKMESAESNMEFIISNIFRGGGGQADICEIGGGNGKLLYSLEKKGILQSGINYEVSKSRVELAERFAKLLASQKVENRNQNFLDDSTKENAFDCVIMVDVVWQLVASLYDSAERDMIQWITKALKKNGCLFLEMTDYTDVVEQIKREKEIRRWQEFPKEDPFQYALHKMSLDDDNNLVVEKIFIGRMNEKRDYFKNVIRLYSKKEIIELLEKDFEILIYELPYNYTDMCSEFRMLCRKK